MRLFFSAEVKKWFKFVENNRMKNRLLLFFLFSTAFAFSQSNEEKYRNFINLADSCHEARDYEKALKFYEKALSLKPMEKYPIEKIEKCDAYLRKIAEVELAIKQFHHQADSCFTNKDFDCAKQSYTHILLLKPNEKTAKYRIAEIDKIMWKERLED